MNCSFPEEHNFGQFGGYGHDQYFKFNIYIVNSIISTTIKITLWKVTKKIVS